MSACLDLSSLSRLPGEIARPAFDPRLLKIGLLHIGLGVFHRAHQAVYTEDAIACERGDWGILGVSLRRPNVSALLTPQDHLYTVEFLDRTPSYRVIGALRGSLTAPSAPDRFQAAFADPAISAATLTITEKGYTLDGSGELDMRHPDVAHDLGSLGAQPRSAVGWLAKGLAARQAANAGPMTLISCDNVADNGAKLARALTAFVDAANPSLSRWLADCVAFPRTMVDSIAPATDEACRARVAAALGLRDAAPVQREAFAAWVIEDRFAASRPAWETAGAEIVADVAPFVRIKLHVLNAAHSALAYLGPPRGHTFVREAIADGALAAFLDAMMAEEITPALAPLDVAEAWRIARGRFANPLIDHRLSQIAQDGAAKLAERIFPLLIANARSGRPTARLAAIVRAWLQAPSENDPQADRLTTWRKAGALLPEALNDSTLFPAPFRNEEAVRSAILDAA